MQTATIKRGFDMNIGGFLSDFGGVGIIGSIIMLSLPINEVTAITTISLSVFTAIGQAVVWFMKHQDRKARRRRFDGIAAALESKLTDKINDNSMTANDADTYIKLMEKLDDIDKS
jgi:hypothetical protein